MEAIWGIISWITSVENQSVIENKNVVVNNIPKFRKIARTEI